jgi:hypothetical protein
MTDQELLTLAAKAAGYVTLTNGQTYSPEAGNFDWNPLIDDGDALRLAVQLEIKFSCRADEGVGVWAKASCWRAAVEECAKADKYTAARRAIVRAAAEIGRHMK